MNCGQRKCGHNFIKMRIKFHQIHEFIVCVRYRKGKKDNLLCR